MKQILFFCTFFLTIFNSLFSQKIINEEDYFKWNYLSNIKISNDGNIVCYQSKPLKNDGYIYIINNKTLKKDSFYRADNPVISPLNDFVAFKITPSYDTLRKCELKKIKKDKWPKDTLAIYLIEKDTLFKFPFVEKFQVSEHSNWIAFMKYTNDLTTSFDNQKKKRKKSKSPKYEIVSDGKILIYFNPISNDYIEYANVMNFVFSKKNNIISHVVHEKLNKQDIYQVFVNDLDKKTSKLISEKFLQLNHLEHTKNGKHLLMLSSIDTNKIDKCYRLYHYEIEKDSLFYVADSIFSNKNLKINEKSNFSINYNENKFYFTVKPKIPILKDTLLDSEKVNLDIWHYQDGRLQPQQQKEFKKDEKSGDLYFYELNTHSIKKVCSDSLEISLRDNNPLDFSLAYYSKPYELTYQYDSPWKIDLYLLNHETSEMKLLVKAAINNFDLSPKASYLSYFNSENNQLMLKKIDTDESTCITCLSKDEWLQDKNGMAETPRFRTTIKWLQTENGNEKGFLLFSKNNLYYYDILSSQLNLIHALKEEKFLRLSFFNDDSLYVSKSNTFFITRNENNKSESFYLIDFFSGKFEIKRLFNINENISLITKSKSSNDVILQKQSNTNFPNVYSFSINQNEVTLKQLSDVNSQQKDYNWSTVELIKWKNYEGIELEGLIYKPENFDKTKKYPLLVYYYELHADDLHKHYAPKPTASIIHPTEYASNGYVIFIPDIRYKLGKPARGAYSCIMSGVDYILKIIPQIDSLKMGLQGQSWGGYQTAQLITMTNRFKAAMAGAPVANMFSAYGGIRWGSGLNRQFQYEKAQSRIGKTIWEAPELYLENSPLFHLPKVETPLLIMHNDMDGAVPWYQGIELFTGLKRLEKPVWMLNYIGDDHNLTKLPNKIDLSIRMKQFFDHYLQDKAMPNWMKNGVKYAEKDHNKGLGFE